ncbi:MAG: DNA repair protein [Methyloprofundus sp.]|nr:DNA repair protein [Methyloprofundus sp.]
MEYTQAKFWKCALQVNPFSYIKFRGTDHGMTEDEYNHALLQMCIKEQIKVLGIADHGNVDGVDAIRDLMKAHDIVVFPGFEIASSEKVHFVCLYSEETTAKQLERYLGDFKLLDTKDLGRPSKLSAEQLIAQVNEVGGFIYAAHCTAKNGLLKGRFNHIWQLSGLKGAQIPESIGALKGVEDDFYHKVINNKNSAYRRENKIAVINAKDVEAPETLSNPSASCLIKMTVPSFTSFKQAFLDPESRVRLNSDIPDKVSSYIESIRIINGYLDGLNIMFSPHLNAVIGGRGTGKSTLLECIRFVLDIKPVGVLAQKQHDIIIKENLGKERAFVELKIRSAAMQGQCFIVSRKYGDQPVVKDEKGHISSFLPIELLPRIEIFGQNEIYEIAQDVGGQRQLIERFISSEHNNFDRQIQENSKSLANNRGLIIAAKEQLAEVEQEVHQLPKLLEQASQFQALGLEEKLAIVPKLEMEKRLLQRVNSEMDSLKATLLAVQDVLPDPVFLSDQVLKDLPHQQPLIDIRQIIEELGVALKENTQRIAQSVISAETQLAVQQDLLQAGINKNEVELETAFKDIPASQGKAGQEIGVQYQAILKRIEKIKPKKITLDQRKAVVDELFNKRKAILAELSKLRAERSANLQRTLKALNKKLQGKLKLSLQTEANREPLFEFLCQANLEGVGAARLAWIKTNEADFSPENLAITIRQGTQALKEADWGVTPVIAEALVKLSESKLLELEELELLDGLEIKLNVAHNSSPENYRSIDRLSTGQQCTAILHMLLLENKDPLILDQPEDNLDNAFIAERIVSELRAAKIARQFLFATHNANIPVFGDAEWIGVLNVDDGKAYISDDQQGAIDLPAIQVLAADILEGGKNAFNQRREKYGFQ